MEYGCHGCVGSVGSVRLQHALLGVLGHQLGLVREILVRHGLVDEVPPGHRCLQLSVFDGVSLCQRLARKKAVLVSGAGQVLVLH